MKYNFLSSKIKEKEFFKFKEELKKSLFLTPPDEIVFNSIPDEVFFNVFESNFNKDIDLAKKILWNDFDNINYEDLDEHIKNINNYEKSINLIQEYLDNKKPIFFICDTDNDGSSAQASLIEFKKVFKENTLITEYWQVINDNNDIRGFSFEFVDYLTKKLGFKNTEDMLIVTADNGINSSGEAKKIEEKFKKAKILITDHHNPNENVVIENDRVTIFNPKYKPNDYFKNKNISGAHTISVLLQELIKRNYPEKTEEINNIEEIAKISNQLDYVRTDIRHKPVKNYVISKFSSLGNIMNVNNSSSQILIGDWSIDVLEKLKNEDKNIDVESIKKSLLKIKTQNLLAYNLLHIITNYNNDVIDDDLEQVYSGDTNDVLFERLSETKINFEKEVNPNFVSQLRPYLINYEAKGDKNLFESNLSESISNVFKTIKNEERKIMDELRKVDIMEINKEENSTILTPKNKDITKIFNRKFLTKTFNEENNGFLLVVYKSSKDLVSGSMRSVYDIELYLKELKSFEKKHGVELSYIGHNNAAGFFIKKVKKDITENTIVELNKEMSKVIKKIKIQESKKNNKFIISNFDSIDLINRINAKIKANLPNSQAIEPLIQIKKDTYITDSKSTAQMSIEKMVKDKKYGYKPIAINFAGDAMILPVEMVKQVIKNGYKDYIQLGYMDEGAFIGKAIKISDVVKDDNLLKIEIGESERRYLESYYKEHYKKENNYTVNITEDMLREIPYFKNNKYSEIEFNRFKNMVIDILDKSNSEILAITDTEGTGLGQAPKLFNIGSMDLMIDETKSEIINLDEFNNKVFKNFKGTELIIDKNNVTKISKSEYNDLSFEKQTNYIVQNNKDEYFLLKDKNNVKVIQNKIIKDNNVIINRGIKAEMISLLINNSDIKLPQEIITLTGIDNKMVKSVGLIASEVDQIWKKRYEGKKVIFQAHNLPYDNGIIKTNLKETSHLIRNNLVSDSALYSRIMKLAYDKIRIAKVPFVPELKLLEFYDSPYSDVSFTRFLEDENFNRIPDRTGNYTIKKDGNKLKLIDKKRDKEIELSETLDTLITNVERDEMNLRSIKYSVQMLSLHEVIRNMLLSKIDLEKDVKYPELNSDYGNLSEKEDLIKFFMKEYHFDETLKENISNFKTALLLLKDEEDINFFRNSKNTEYLELFGNIFLEKNRDIVSRFQEAWIYKKVLEIYDPISEETDEDTIKQIAYTTDLPKYKIKNVLKDAFEYKKDFNLSHSLVHECHNNVIYDRDGYGDVVLEGVLTIKRLVDTTYNSYTNLTEDPTLIFLNNILNTKVASLNSDIGDVALDAYSRKQAQSYTRKNKTDKINEMLKPQRLRLKLGNDILPQGSFIEIEKAKKYLTKANIKDLEEKIKFIVINKIVESSICVDINKKFHISVGSAEVIKLMLEENEPIIQQYKKDIHQLLGGIVKFERKRDFIKDINNIITKIHLDESFYANKLKSDVVLNDIDLIEIETFNKYYKDTLDKMKIHSSGENIIEVKDKNDEYIEVKTMDYFFELLRERNILCKEKEDEYFKELSELYNDQDFKILNSVAAKKNKLLNWIVSVCPEFMDAYIQKGIELKSKKTLKAKP